MSTYLCISEQLPSGLTVLEEAAVGNLEVETPLQ